MDSHLYLDCDMHLHHLGLHCDWMIVCMSGSHIIYVSHCPVQYDKAHANSKMQGPTDLEHAPQAICNMVAWCKRNFLIGQGQWAICKTLMAEINLKWDNVILFLDFTTWSHGAERTVLIGYEHAQSIYNIEMAGLNM